MRPPFIVKDSSISIKRDLSAFSLVELIVSLSILLVITALAFPAYSEALRQSQRVDSLKNLRLIAIAVQLYSNENNGLPPGPLDHTQWTYMKRSNTAQLSWQLRDYLEASNKENGQIIQTLGNKRFFSLCNPQLQTAYIINHKVLISGTAQSAWGYAGTGSPPQKLFSIDNPPTAIGLIEVDQELLAEGGNKASNFSPVKPLFRDGRGAMFFDGHAAVVSFSYRLGQTNLP